MVDQTQRLSRYRELIQELNETKKMEIARRTVELFFSFDIVNSSLYKTINYTGWYNVIISLFKEIQASVMKLMPGAEMWRVLGDEIVFIIPIKENKDFFVYTDKIFEILNIFVLKLKNGQFFDELEIDNDKKLLMKMQNVISLKAAAWIAIVGENGVVAIQCKNYQDMSVSISMIDQWIQGAEEFKPEISHFIIAIGAKTDGEIQKYVLEKNQYRQSHNLFSVEVVYWEEISAFLKSDARILQRYYPFINTDGIQDQFDIAYSSLDIIRHDFVELILRYKILDFLLEDPFVGIKTEYLILSDKFDIALKDLLQRTVFLQETELYQKIIAFCGKWNKYNGYIGLKVQPSNNGQYVRMNQVLMEDYEEIEAIVQRMKSEICEIYESISQ